MGHDNSSTLSKSIRQNVDEMKKICGTLSEEKASRAPEGRWSPKQILSHLCGPEGSRLTDAIHKVLEQETPRIDIDTGNPFFSARRSQMSTADLLSALEQRYNQAADLIEGLSETQLARRAYVPAFKQAPMGEYLTLAELIDIVGVKHPESHIVHMREILKELGTA